MESVDYLIFLPRFLCTKHQVTNRGLIEELVGRLDCFHVCHASVHLLHRIHLY